MIESTLEVSQSIKRNLNCFVLVLAMQINVEINSIHIVKQIKHLLLSQESRLWMLIFQFIQLFHKHLKLFTISLLFSLKCIEFKFSNLIHDNLWFRPKLLILVLEISVVIVINWHEMFYCLLIEKRHLFVTLNNKVWVNLFTSWIQWHIRGSILLYHSWSKHIVHFFLSIFIINIFVLWKCFIQNLNYKLFAAECLHTISNQVAMFLSNIWILLENYLLNIYQTWILFFFFPHFLLIIKKLLCVLTIYKIQKFIQCFWIILHFPLR